MTSFAMNILTNPAFSIITLLLGFLIGHRLSLGRDKRQEFNEAASDFRKAFLPEIIYLKHNANIGDIGNSTSLNECLLYGYTHRHLKALEVFKPNLSHKDRLAIDKAWREYCYYPDNPHTLFFEMYSWKVANKGKGHENDLKSLALSLIEKLLEFAQPK